METRLRTRISNGDMHLVYVVHELERVRSYSLRDLLSIKPSHRGATAMGSYLSIVNDTSDPWQCKIGPDEKALMIFGYVFTALSIFIKPLASTAGDIGKVGVRLLDKNVVGVFGLSTSALAKLQGGSALASKISTTTMVAGYPLLVFRALLDSGREKGFRLIDPGQKERWGKMSLSLWQQGTCMRVVGLNETAARVDMLYMRPIFSGSTKNSNRDHKIQWWINKSGVRSTITTADASSMAPKATTPPRVITRNSTRKRNRPCSDHRILQAEATSIVGGDSIHGDDLVIDESPYYTERRLVINDTEASKPSL